MSRKLLLRGLRARSRLANPDCTKSAEAPLPWNIPHCAFDATFNDLQHDAEVRASRWHKLWLVEHPSVQPLGDYDSALEELTQLGLLQDIDELIHLSSRFKANTALDSDWLHPKHLSRLSDYSLQAFLVRARLILLTGMLPATYLFYTCPSTQTPRGDRPVGRFPTTIRLIPKQVRRVYGNKWLAEHPRDDLCGSKGKSAIDCA